MGVKKSFLLMNFYLGGLDVPIPSEGKGDRFKAAAQSIERNVEYISRVTGDHQRIKNIKS
jgi:hypothetical protein